MLQCEKPVLVWGRSEPGSVISVGIQGKDARAEAGADGSWTAVLPPLHASSSETMVITSGEETAELHNVAVGEVWIAGGQSNMEFYMRYEKHCKEAKRDCTNSRIRFFDVPEVCYDGQSEDFDYSRMGFWRAASPEDLDYFSAVGYYFQKELEAARNVPVGIIGCNWGGTVAAAWMRPETVERVGKPWMDKFRATAEYQDMERYMEEQRANPMNDRGNPFADPFNELVMPRTPDEDEIRELFANIPSGDAYFDMVFPQDIPGSLYEHMLKTIAPFSVRGFLWYQGESDDIEGFRELYTGMLAGLIGDWRALWGDDALPFLIVQLPGFLKWLDTPPMNDYGVIRRCQQEVCDTVPDTWLCSISDVGEEMDIHPKDKKTVGHRLALLARGHVYGEHILCDAPRAAECRMDDGQIRIAFSNAEGGLYIEGGELEAMQILCGGAEIPFDSEADDAELILTLKEEPGELLQIRFAQTCWCCVNLYNRAGIPAVPFEYTIF